MKFTNKDLANAMGLKVGDKIKLEEMILKVTNNYRLEKQENKKVLPLWLLVDTDKDFEIVKPKKKVGEQICREIECPYCPLRGVCYEADATLTLFDVLEDTNIKMCNDKEIYDILKARLDKEVEE